MATTIPYELRLVTPPTLPQARSYLFAVKSTQDVYDTNYLADIQIDIPRLQRSYLTKDSYLGFTIEYTYIPGKITTSVGTPEYAFVLDTPGAFGLFDAIEVYDYLGNTLLERIGGHAQLMALLLDADPQGFGPHAANGTRTGIIASPCNQTATDYNPHFIQADPQDVGPVSGDVFPATASLVTQTIRKDYAIPLLSFLGRLSPKYAPLHNGYTIILKRAKNENAYGLSPLGLTSTVLASDSLGSMNIINPTFYAQILELGPTAEALVQASLGGEPMVVHTDAYRNYSTTWAGQTDANYAVSYRDLPLNINVASMKKVIWIMRDLAQLDGVSKRSHQRIRNYLESWHFQYGSSSLPNTSGIECRSSSTSSAGSGTAALSELAKALDCVDKPTNFHDSNWNFDTYTTNAGEVICPFMDVDNNGVRLNSEPYGRFAAGLSTTLMKNGETINGLNCNGILTTIRAKFNPISNKQMNSGKNQMRSVRVDAWAVYDAFISIVPGVSSSVAF